MKKILIGLAIGFVVAIPSIAFAGYPFNSAAKVIGGTDCETVIGNDGKPYPSTCNVDIDKFTDKNNVCYIVVGGSYFIRGILN